MARRLQRPGWRDARLIIGVLLVVVSVVGGARLIAALDDGTAVYVAAEPLVPGQEVTAADLDVVDIRFAQDADLYLSAAGEIEPGTYALRGVPTGELIPAAALGGASQVESKAVTVSIDPATASSIHVGSVVDLWVSRRDPQALGAVYVEPELLLSGAVVSTTLRRAPRLALELVMLPCRSSFPPIVLVR
ncbi:flagellar biosynthesis protein FlgA [Ornithinimicrobium sp. INDO-MA30-4]|uniref:flagellar biosynthesis protein FlgA n=1 Tax=Ornithinimicrobium sp. INDO-MA30-4 TaxID=2908651 RepID=UPI001F3A0F21|nr:flagellar biosynthesis protein FlgA [Ornithinimicrobium sp. INDO-MA30-4]UJH71407.1 flagellar biosynthesis protein FlgA [Ornithinimicrobium sp. INDO-MA30-4]